MAFKNGFLLSAIQALSWAIFLGLWGLVAASDYKQRKIRHRHLAFGLKFALVCYALMLASTALGERGLVSVYYHWNFYSDLGGYLASTAVAAMALWWARIWPAGDTKLFLFLAAVYPMMKVSSSFQSGWLFLSVLINIFLPACAAIFLQAARHVWRTRLRHIKEFWAQMGLRRWLGYVREKSREFLLGALGEAREDCAWARQNPGAVLLKACGWVLSMVVMAALSCAVKDFLGSALLRTLFCFAVLYLANRLRSLIGRTYGWIPAVFLIVFLAIRRPEFLGPELWRAFGALAVFSLFLQLGIKWTVGLMAGQVLMLALPFVGLLMGLIPRGLASRFSSFLGAGPVLAWALQFLPLACLGVFFGLTWTFVRAWDNEDHPDIPRDKILSYMVLHHSFLSQLAQDEDFHAEHFSAPYADGLTEEQVVALKAWCASHGIETVPLATTMAFSHWIFLGYFITCLLGRHVLSLIL